MSKMKSAKPALLQYDSLPRAASDPVQVNAMLRSRQLKIESVYWHGKIVYRFIQ